MSAQEIIDRLVMCAENYSTSEVFELLDSLKGVLNLGNMANGGGEVCACLKIWSIFLGNFLQC